ncbi:MAG: YqaE/Pmp3 family membrane protein, partial [Halomonas sp.]
MDAREYLARRGLDGERDRERPNTLEEKAWSRAREAGDHRPRAGTPFDWEEWERYHDDLAEGAETITQKVDHEAHRRALVHKVDDARGEGAVGTFTPSSDHAVDDKRAGGSRGAPR